MLLQINTYYLCELCALGRDENMIRHGFIVDIQMSTETPGSDLNGNK
jgi:hypothetical protein